MTGKQRPPETSQPAEPFLSRWSQRKLAQAESPLEEAAADSPTPQPPALTDADMPPLESLDEHSDYSGFLSPKVSEVLRQQALQKLFRSAGFNLCDGLDDYAEDFTHFEKLGDVLTSDLRFRLQQEAQRAAERDEALAENESTPRQSSPTAERESPADGPREAAQDAERPMGDRETRERST